MKNQATDILRPGRNYVDPIMSAHGFTWEAMWAGKSSGGFSNSGLCVRDDRSLELHFRHSLGLVTYRIGDLSLRHEDYMRQCAPGGAAQYPGFSNDPIDAFAHLAHDLSAFAADFLSGSGEQLKLAKVAAGYGERHAGRMVRG